MVANSFKSLTSQVTVTFNANKHLQELVSHLKTLTTGADVAELMKFQNYITKEQRTALLGDSIHSSVLF